MVPFYQFEAISLQGKPISLADYQGKVILVVNTASQCKLTPQFKGLEMLYQQYQSDGLVILGFPCNQFRQQEPGNAQEINEVCQLNYGVTFPMFDKVRVNGKHSSPIYQYLKQELPGFFGSFIKWNFTKFLIGRDGLPIKRYAPISTPKSIEQDIVNALKT